MIERKIPYVLVGLLIIYIFQQDFSFFQPVAIIAGLSVVGISFLYYFKEILSKNSNSHLTLPLTFLLVSYILAFFYSYDYKIALDYFKLFTLVNFIFFPFYYFSKQNLVNEKFLNFILILLISLYAYDYFFTLRNIISMRINGSDLGLGDVTNNVGYNFVTLMPLVLFIRKPIVKLMCIFIILFFVLYSAKRGAILVGAIAIFLMLKNTFKEIQINKYRIFLNLLLLLTIVIGIYQLTIFFEQNQNIAQRFVAMAEGDSSNRDVLIRNCLNGFYSNGTFFSYLFGQGLGGTWQVAGNMAHNDWVELLVNNGLTGIVLLGYYYYSIYYSYKKCTNYFYKPVLLLCFVLLFLRTIISMSFFDTSSIPIIIVLGYVLGKVDVSYNDKNKIESI